MQNKQVIFKEDVESDLKPQPGSSTNRFRGFPSRVQNRIKNRFLPRFKRNDKITPETEIEEIKQEELHHNKLNHLVNKSYTVFLKVTTVFPFDLFPNEICIEPNQVHIIVRDFFFEEHYHSIPIKNIQDVVVQMSVFFAALTIIDSAYVQNSITVEYLKKEDAKKARRIIQGLVIASKEGVDLSKLPLEEIKHKFELLGQATAVE